MIPRSQHFGDPAPFPLKRSGIMRIFEKAGFKAFLLTAGRRAHYPGQQPNASIEQDESRRLAAGQHIVTDRHRDNGPGLEKSLVDALETAAKHRNARSGGELAHQGLVERRARAASSPAAARPDGARGRDRPPAPARRRASPSPPRRRPACRRPNDACRWRNRGSGPSPATRSPPPAPARRGCDRAARETSPG